MERLDADKTIQAHESILDLSMQERADADKTIKAQEAALEIAFTERKDADGIIHAQEAALALSEKERREADGVIHAHESLEALCEEERRVADTIINAHESLQDLTAYEQQEAERIIKAQQAVHELSENERRAFQEVIKVRESISELAEQELRDKDTLIANILAMAHDECRVLETKPLCELVLADMVEKLSLERGIVFLKQNDKFSSTYFKNLTPDDTKLPEIAYSMELVKRALETREYVLFDKETFSFGENEMTMSAVAVPLLYDDEPLGALYADTRKSDHTFPQGTRFLLDYFSRNVASFLKNSYYVEHLTGDAGKQGGNS